MDINDALHDAEYNSRANEAVREREHHILLTCDPSGVDKGQLHIWKKGNRLWLIGAMVVAIVLVIRSFISDDD